MSCLKHLKVGQCGMSGQCFKLVCQYDSFQPVKLKAKVLIGHSCRKENICPNPGLREKLFSLPQCLAFQFASTCGQH